MWHREYSVDAVHRKIMEELGSEITNVELQGASENIFVYEGESGDEVVFMYTADLVNQELYDQKEISILDHPEGIAEWISVEQVLNGEKVLYPEYDYTQVFSRITL